MTTTAKRPAKVGRPRAVSDTAPETSPRDQILTAAAALFVEQGFGSTSTRAIADAVGMRQASLYYHFAGKDEILAELLETSVRPSVEFGALVLGLVPDEVPAATALYALALLDVATLSEARHNIGTLYLLPEVQDARYDVFRAERAELQAAYGRLAALAREAAGSDAAETLAEELQGAVLIQLVEVVIQLRRRGAADMIDADALAASCLRVVGLPGAATSAAAAEAAAVVKGYRDRA